MNSISLESARKYAEKFRYSGDAIQATGTENVQNTRIIRGVLAQSGIQINQTVTPGLFQSLRRVFERLRIPPDAVHAFVYPSSEIQAGCFTGSRSQCIIKFSSAIIDLLDENELEFVAGHELGHFLLGHDLIDDKGQKESVEFYIQRRYQEISVDRIGLLACQSLDVAMKVLMKTISGLTDKHLRYDVGTFLSQLRHVGQEHQLLDAMSSHPSILIRCRALLWFSMNYSFETNGEDYSTKQRKKTDNLINNDMEKYVDGPVKRLIKEAKDDLSFWMVVNEIVRDDVFNRKEQEIIKQQFGSEMLEKLKNFLSNVDASSAHQAVGSRVEVAKKKLQTLIPTNFEHEVKDIQSRIIERYFTRENQ